MPPPWGLRTWRVPPKTGKMDKSIRVGISQPKFEGEHPQNQPKMSCVAILTLFYKKNGCGVFPCSGHGAEKYFFPGPQTTSVFLTLGASQAVRKPFWPQCTGVAGVDFRLGSGLRCLARAGWHTDRPGGLSTPRPAFSQEARRSAVAWATRSARCRSGPGPRGRGRR